jgi:hypothetical protein
MECLEILSIYIYMNLDYLKFTRLQLIFFFIIIRFENSRYIQYFKVELHVIKSFHLQKLLENNL